MAPERYLYDQSSAATKAPEVFVRHPWPIRDIAKELEEEAASGPRQAGSVVLKDGLEFVIDASPEALGPNVEAAMYVGFFSYSYTGSEDIVEAWMREGNLPPPHNPLRLWTLFSHQYPGGKAQADELGDACVGEAFRAEFCARIMTCFRATGNSQVGGGSWRIAVPVRWASNYRLEAYLGQPSEECQAFLPAEASSMGPSELPWWAPVVAQHSASSQSNVARHAAFTRLRVLHVNQMSYWWAHNAQVETTSCWTEMMAAAVNSAATSPAAQPERYGLRANDPRAPRGLWLEFGVGSGKTTAAIGLQMKSLFNDDAVLHGFDSFQGLPVSWDYTHLGVGTFSTGGQVPQHLKDMTNVKIHVGLFTKTLSDLDDPSLRNFPVAFAHIDVDLYTSAVEVLSKIACQLLPGSVLVFDELVNYVGFELSGEYRAWEYIASAYQIRWDYAGLYWQQAVPLVITERGRAC
eukprot:TRINITY_DN65993_c0_g1_i1.p1 TRINITY_DN65993_c0_g1~~TRINITY_DN65993_c0_g1_i1.p1  ORF type:complete len:533 (-),score=95.71 TRINITY_DN65993_c0_g1_i1:89-1477(-)